MWLWVSALLALCPRRCVLQSFVLAVSADGVHRALPLGFFLLWMGARSLFWRRFEWLRAAELAEVLADSEGGSSDPRLDALHGNDPHRADGIHLSCGPAMGLSHK